MIPDVHLAAHAHREVEQPHLLGLLALVQERSDLLARVAVVVGLLGLGSVQLMRELGEGSDARAGGVHRGDRRDGLDVGRQGRSLGGAGRLPAVTDAALAIGARRAGRAGRAAVARGFAARSGRRLLRPRRREHRAARGVWTGATADVATHSCAEPVRSNRRVVPCWPAGKPIVTRFQSHARNNGRRGGDRGGRRKGARVRVGFRTSSMNNR